MHIDKWQAELERWLEQHHAADDGAHDLAHFRRVITSYSIHYTKLYEGRIQPGMELRMNYGKHVLAGLLVAVLMTACGGGKDLSGGSSTDAGSNSADGSTSNDETTPASRITSYNVCYTKLLRNSFCTSGSQLIRLSLRPLSARITSYNVCYTKLLRLCGYNGIARYSHDG